MSERMRSRPRLVGLQEIGFLVLFRRYGIVVAGILITSGASGGMMLFVSLVVMIRILDVLNGVRGLRC